MGGSGVVRLHASLVLFLVFVNFCLTKKEKRKKRKLLPFAKVFSLANKCFLISRKFLLAKVSVPKVTYMRNETKSNIHEE